MYQRYVVTAMSSMAFGLFGSLIIGVVFVQLAKIHGLAFLTNIADVTQQPLVIGGAIGAANYALDQHTSFALEQIT